MGGKLVFKDGAVVGFNKTSKFVWFDSPDPHQHGALWLSRKSLKGRRLATVTFIRFGTDMSSLNYIRRPDPSSSSSLQEVIKNRILSSRTANSVTVMIWDFEMWRLFVVWLAEVKGKEKAGGWKEGRGLKCHRALALASRSFFEVQLRSHDPYL